MINYRKKALDTRTLKVLNTGKLGFSDDLVCYFMGGVVSPLPPSSLFIRNPM